MSPSARLQNHSLIKCIDLAVESLDRFGEPAVGGETRSRILALRPSKGPPPKATRGKRLLEYSSSRIYHRTHRSPDPSECRSLCKWIVGEDDYGAAAVASPPGATPPPPSPQSSASNNRLEEQEWEISKINGKRRAGRGYEYKVRWRSIWLPRSELGSAQQLLQKFEAQLEAQLRAQRGSKCRKAARAGWAG